MCIYIYIFRCFCIFVPVSFFSFCCRCRRSCLCFRLDVVSRIVIRTVPSPHPRAREHTDESTGSTGARADGSQNNHVPTVPTPHCTTASYNTTHTQPLYSMCVVCKTAYKTRGFDIEELPAHMKNLKKKTVLRHIEMNGRNIIICFNLFS